MASTVKVSYSTKRIAVDPQETSVTIVGQVGNLRKVTYDDVRGKLEKRVSEEVRVRLTTYFFTFHFPDFFSKYNFMIFVALE